MRTRKEDERKVRLMKRAWASWEKKQGGDRWSERGRGWEGWETARKMKAGSDRKRTELFDVILCSRCCCWCLCCFVSSNVLICISIPARHPAQSWSVPPDLNPINIINIEICYRESLFALILPPGRNRRLSAPVTWCDDESTFLFSLLSV